MQHTKNPTDRRQFGRRVWYAHGTVIIAGRPPTHCLLRDISGGGALLEFGEDVWLPFRFKLTIESMGIETYCEIRHQRDKRVGAMFVDDELGVQATIEAFDTRRCDADDCQGTGLPGAEAVQDPLANPSGGTLRERLFRRLTP